MAMQYTLTSARHHRELSERLVDLSSRLDAKFHALEDRTRADVRRPASGVGGARAAGARIGRTSVPRRSEEERQRRWAGLHRQIESAVRRGAIWKAVKYEIALDLDILRHEIEHDIDLLISDAAPTKS